MRSSSRPSRVSNVGKLLGAAFLGLALTACGSPDRDVELCIPFDCQSGLSGAIRVPGSLVSKTGVEFRACLNGACSVGPLPSRDTPSPCDLKGPIVVERCSLVIGKADGGDARLNFLIRHDRPKDGDDYSIRIHDPSGSVKDEVLIEQRAIYESLPSADSVCEPICHVAQISDPRP